MDHRGTNNAFQSKVESPLAILYSTSTMEHHHFDQCVMILNSDGNNIFQVSSSLSWYLEFSIYFPSIFEFFKSIFRKSFGFGNKMNLSNTYWLLNIFEFECNEVKKSSSFSRAYLVTYLPSLF